MADEGNPQTQSPRDMSDSGSVQNDSSAETLGPGDQDGTLSLSSSGPRFGPTQIDDHKLTRKVAQGGMGEVYEAEQLRPVRRKVAIKLIRHGVVGEEFAARFESERQALAVMDHSNIAKIFEAGTSQAGQPYFSMEFVRGVRITEHADNAKLGLRNRLAMFLDVCDGVSHAHQKGIIHRDIKPSNVLVTVESGKATPKIIDFGLAKATGEGEALGETTRVGQVVGTPAYMSPEQMSTTPAGIDTRTDVYALGVLLYELLTGVLPYELDPVTQFEDLKQRICEEPPVAPSIRLEGMGEDSANIADRRGTDPRALVRELRGDLDWIVLKALEKERDRRYQSVYELASDIQRHLANEPVLASPPGRVYRMQKFVRRHRVGVSAAAAVLAAVLGGATLAGVGFVEARRAEQEARQAEEQARQEAETANQVTEFLVELYSVSDPSEARGNSITARELLDRGAERIRTELQDEPVVRARLLSEMGRVYQALGLYPTARELMESALETSRQIDNGTVQLHNLAISMARLSWQQGLTDEALDYARQAVAEAEENVGTEHPDTAAALQMLGVMYRDRAEYEEAEEYLRRSLEVTERTEGPGHVNVVGTLQHLAWLYQLQADYMTALPLYERALSVAEREWTSDPLIAYLYNDVGVLYGRLANYELSEEYYRKALAVQERTLEPNHPAIAGTVENIGVSLWYQDRMLEARPHYERSLQIRRETLGTEHPLVAVSLSNLALVLRALGDLDGARILYEEGLRVIETTSGPDHPDTANVLGNLGNLLARMGDFDAARSTLERALTITETVLGPAHPDVADTLTQLSFAHMRQGNRDEARAILERALTIRENALGPYHVQVAIILRDLGRLRRSSDYLERAVDAYEGQSQLMLADTLWDLAWLQESAGNSELAGETASRARTVAENLWGEGAARQTHGLARGDALAGFPEQALFKLWQAAEQGFAQTDVGDDEAFVPLRGDPGFEAVVAQIESRVQ